MLTQKKNSPCSNRTRGLSRAFGVLNGLGLCLLAGLYPLPTLASETPGDDSPSRLDRQKPMGVGSLEDTSLIRVLENYYETNLGGPENWAGIESIRFDGQLHLPGGAVRFSAYKKKPDYCKIILYPGSERQIIMAYDGEEAWQLDTGQSDAQPTAMPPKEAVNFIRDATTGSHLLYPALPEKTITLGSVIEVEGVMGREVHVGLPGGQTISYVLDLENHAERQQITTNAVNGEREVTTHYEYEEIGGVRFPTSSIMRVDGEEIHRIEMTEITLNTGLMPWMFARPSEDLAAGKAPGPTQLDLSTEPEASKPSAFSTESSNGSAFELPPNFGSGGDSVFEP